MAGMCPLFFAPQQHMSLAVEATTTPGQKVANFKETRVRCMRLTSGWCTIVNLLAPRFYIVAAAGSDERKGNSGT
eukprot:1159631-Pelagomonas_calceolata.AAC.4